ncbi:putative Chase2 sensor protein [Richelia sinica FACHB-800]|uniref:Chase2 sensor protein n=1 Tax=Richelia sinica FACHB-800 TaxID=1357546 RepID=A0A975Y2S6_9NOST|nr:CHASE2 domain-containing protein [Richelia sinica]MBD2665318.1 CHASE2 domain-containing protein [Richelia sinica FACHB-800]QXE21406.1 putative Chase2 sensor protein [Richelia sinica FACHB-800]
MDLPSLISALAAAAGALITVLRYMQESQKPAEAEPTQVTEKFIPLIRYSKFQTAFLASVIIVGLLMGVVRPSGLLQSSELMAFDRMMRSRPLEQPDPRLLVVTVTDDDLDYQNQKKMQKGGESLSDQALEEVLRKLSQHEPRVIGLDIFRDFSVNQKFPELTKQFQDNKRLIVTCSVERTKAPPEIPSEQNQRLGFSNIPEDSDEVIRRQFLGMTPSDQCYTDQSFSLRIALLYLETKNVSPIKLTPDKKTLQIGKVFFPKLVSDAGGYQLPREEELGYQILLNYRSLKTVESIAQQISLTDILEDAQKDRLPSLVNDHIILIGTTAPSSNPDFHMTPYGEKIPGVFIQAHMVSQIISAVLDPRPLLWWWPPIWEIIWVWLWALVVGILIEYWRSPLRRTLVVGIAIAILYGLCFFAFTQGGWLPLIPSTLSLFFTSACVAIALAYSQTTSSNS